MGMTIDKAIDGIEKRILPIYDNDADHEALAMAIDTMRKYQKIQEVLEKVWNASSCTLDKTPTFNLECLIEIMETYRTVR